MLDVLDGFIAELRAAGIAVSVRESIDAAEAVSAVGLGRRDALEAALATTLVKSPEHRPIFRATFEVYFSLRDTTPLIVSLESDDELSSDEHATANGSGGPHSGDHDPLEVDDVRRLATEALRSGDLLQLTTVARLAVELFGGVDPSRPVGVSYYLHRTLRGLELEALLAAILADRRDDGFISPELGPLGDRLRAEEAEERSETLRELIEAEIRRRLVESRGAAQVARTLRRPLIDDIDFISATRDELTQMRRTIGPLARILATRLARRRRRGRHGTLDFRSTIRRSLSTGGVPLEPRFRPPHPAQPEIVVLADVSGSVASFARFTVHLVYAISSQFSKVRTAVFIDGVEDVTDLLRRTPSIGDAVAAIAINAPVVQGDGHSDYGRALSEFHSRFARSIGGRTNVIVLGDARNNYHQAEAWVLEDLHRRARKIIWLNPEPRAYWGSGDSIMQQYAPYCDGVFECRNLRQLRAFVDELA